MRLSQHCAKLKSASRRQEAPPHATGTPVMSASKRLQLSRHPSADPVFNTARARIRLSTSVAAGLLVGSMLCSRPVAAADNFVQLYIAAHGGCGNPAWSPLAFVLVGQEVQAPFGRAAGDWSDDDLASLKIALAACQATSAQAGNAYSLQEIRQQSDELLTRVPKIVAQAKGQAKAKAQQIEARRQMAAARIDKAAQAKQQAKASAEVEVARLEREATMAEAEARDAQNRLDERIQRATRARNEAKATAAAIAGMERSAADDVGTLPRARRAAPGELSEQDDEVSADGRDAQPTVTAVIDTLACRTIEEVIRIQQPSPTLGQAEPASTALGTCRTLAKGTRAVVQAAAASATTRALCVTLEGQPGCFWVGKAAFDIARQ